MQNLFSAISEIESINRKGARFASVTYTAKESGEVARHTLIFGINLANAYRRDIAILEAKRPSLSGVSVVACDELLASLRESLTVGIGKNSAYTCADTYVQLAKGIKAHKTTGELYVTGFTVGKTVLVPGVHKRVNSSAKTLAKNALRKGMKSGKFRQFSLPAATEIKANGNVLTFAPAAPVPASLPTVAPATAPVYSATTAPAKASAN